MKPNAIALTNLRIGEIYAAPINGNPKRAWKSVYEHFRTIRDTPDEAFMAEPTYETTFDKTGPVTPPTPENGTSHMLGGQACVLCGDQIVGYGNNPDPLAKEGRCCDWCNSMKVIPARLEQVRRLSQDQA